MLDPNTPPGTRVLCILNTETPIPACNCGEGFWKDASGVLTVGKTYTLAAIYAPRLPCAGPGVEVTQLPDKYFGLLHFKVAELPEEITGLLTKRRVPEPETVL